VGRALPGGAGVQPATGVVNVGGFSASILASLLVGADPDLAGRSDPPAHRVAFGCAVAVRGPSREPRHRP
jgi:hypothetical protein